MHDMPSSNKVWGAYLYKLGYRRHIVQDTYPDIYTIKKFCEDNPRGAFLVCTDNIEEIQEKEGHQYEKDGSYGYWGVGYGGRMPYNDRYSYGNSGMNNGGGNSYGYDNGYSRMSSSDKMMHELQMMMDESTSARDKSIIQRAMDELKK